MMVVATPIAGRDAGAAANDMNVPVLAAALICFAISLAASAATGASNSGSVATTTIEDAASALRCGLRCAVRCAVRLAVVAVSSRRAGSAAARLHAREISAARTPVVLAKALL